jgi:phosphate:Na+ symporter
MDILEFIGGIGVFLFGMQLAERSLKVIGGRTFKLFLKKHTENKFKAMASGAFATGLLQSSSVVSFIILAFLGANLINMQNALAVVMGANLGTTLSSWIVATIGFKLDIEDYSFGILGLSSLTMAVFHGNKKIENICTFLIGFSFIFIGLSYIRESMVAIVERTDLRAFSDLPLLYFLFLGILITLMIQSSSATVAVVLSALHTGALSFLPAVAIVLGSELGTVAKFVIGSINGLPDKRRVVLGNLIFNVIISFLAFLFIHPLVFFVNHILNISDQLLALVSIQSLINFGGLLIFYPFLERFAKWLNTRFLKEQHKISLFIGKTEPGVPEAATDAMKKEAVAFFKSVCSFNSSLLWIDSEAKVSDHIPSYERLKKWEAEILSFYASMNKDELEEKEAEMIEKILSSVRNAMYAAKSLKDVTHNISDLKESPYEYEYRIFENISGHAKPFYQKLVALADKHNDKELADELDSMLALIKAEYDRFIKQLYVQIKQGKTTRIKVSSLLNLNREVFTANKAIITSLQNMRLKTGSNAFESIVEAG